MKELTVFIVAYFKLSLVENANNRSLRNIKTALIEMLFAKVF